MIKKFLSFIYPITIYNKRSKLSKNIEVTWYNGILVLNSKNTNYSYGSLQRILRKGLLKIGSTVIKNYNHILVLGVAGGSVIKTLRDELNFSGKITGVDIDEELIFIANKYFKLNEFENTEIIIDNASSFIFKSKENYNLIIIDIFQDTTMPSFLFEANFIEQVKKIICTDGYILFNTMVLSKEDEKRNALFLSFFSSNYSITTLSKIELYNELFIIKKIN